MLEATPTVESGGGGKHFYFLMPEGVVIKSKQGVGKGVDTRGESGYIIAPPSNHESGGVYKWMTDLDFGISHAPDWLLSIVAEPKHQQIPSNDLIFTMQSDEHTLASHPGESEGKRNDTLMRLLGIHISRGDSLATMEALAWEWAKRCNPPCSEQSIREKMRWASAKMQEKEMDDSEVIICLDDGSGSSKQGTKSSVSETSIHPSPTQMLGKELPNSNPPYPHEPEPCTSMMPVRAHYERAAKTTPEPKGVGQTDALALHSDALHGLSGEIVRAIAPETEADPVAVLLTLLTCFRQFRGKNPSTL